MQLASNWEGALKIVAVLASKGGAGKTTCALHLAVEAEQQGIATAVLDTDPQASATGWSDGRKKDTPAVVSIQPVRLVKALETARTDGVELVIIDSPPHSESVAMAAAKAADIIVIPCRPGILDLRAIETTAKIAEMAGTPAFVVISQANARAPKLTSDAMAAIKGEGLTASPVVLHSRAAYAYSLIESKTAREYDLNSKAAEEITALFAWLRGKLHI